MVFISLETLITFDLELLKMYREKVELEMKTVDHLIKRHEEKQPTEKTYKAIKLYSNPIIESNKIEAIKTLRKFLGGENIGLQEAIKIIKQLIDHNTYKIELPIMLTAEQIQNSEFAKLFTPIELLY
jgi:ribosomal protein L7/L12